MILAVDIGNTMTKAAFVDKDKVVARLGAFQTKELLENDFWMGNDASVANISKHIADYKPEGIIISCVLTGQGRQYTDTCREMGFSNTLFVNGDLKYRFSFPEKYKNEIGSDILATCAAADALYGDCIIVDMGTAITFQVIENHIFRGGIIGAGLGMMAQALNKGTSLLPEVETKVPDEFIGFDTVKCIQSGIMHGQASMIDGMIEKTEKYFQKKFTTIATGGDVHKIGGLLKKPFDVTDDDLLFKGLGIIYDDNHS